MAVAVKTKTELAYPYYVSFKLEAEVTQSRMAFRSWPEGPVVLAIGVQNGEVVD
jgi:hypothetical protein